MTRAYLRIAHFDNLLARFRKNPAMTTWHPRVGALALLLTFASSVLVAAEQPAADSPANAQQNRARPVPKDRVFVWDLEGTWVSEAYLQQLQSTRSPRTAGTATPALTIKVQRQERSYPIIITDFHKAA